MSSINLAIVGVGNCASSLLQGIHYYRDVSGDEQSVPGLMHPTMGGYRVSDIEPVAAFDVDDRKVGKDLADAIFAPPNCAMVFHEDVPETGVIVRKGPVLDGAADHLEDYPPHRRLVVSDESTVDVVAVLEETNADVLVNYLPVGSQEATEYYAQAAIEAGCAFVNCIPVFVASEETWAARFEDAGCPVVGDDVKSQIGATIVHRTLAKLFADRGVEIDHMYQLNTGGNTDFLNMLERSRLTSKKISKTESVQSQLPTPLDDDDIHVGPSDYVPWQNDNKVCFVRIEGRKFGDTPVELELRLSVEDSPNSAGVAIDAIRGAKIAMDRDVGGPIPSLSAYLMKHPPIQYPDEIAREKVETFIDADRDE